MAGNAKKMPEIPYYRQASEKLLLVGVSHERFQPGENCEKLAELRGVLARYKNLAFESDEKSHQRMNEWHSSTASYESVALAEFAGKKHFLDEGVDNARILAKYGLTPNTVALLLQVMPKLHMILMRGSMGGFEGVFREVRNETSHSNPFLAGCDARAITRQIPGIVNLLGMNGMFSPMTGMHPAIQEALTDFLRYTSKIRDVEIYLPKIKQLAESGEPTAVLFGFLHADSVAQMIAAEPEALIPWPAYGKTAPGQNGGILLQLVLQQVPGFPL